jgi:hypothetical protein
MSPDDREAGHRTARTSMGEVGQRTSGAGLKRSPLRYCLLVFALSLPFWLIGPVVERRGFRLGVPLDLPVSALLAVCPMVAAVILVHREEGNLPARSARWWSRSASKSPPASSVSPNATSSWPAPRPRRRRLIGPTWRRSR